MEFQEKRCVGMCVSVWVGRCNTTVSSSCFFLEGRCWHVCQSCHEDMDAVFFFIYFDLFFFPVFLCFIVLWCPHTRTPSLFCFLFSRSLLRFDSLSFFFFLSACESACCAPYWKRRTCLRSAVYTLFFFFFVLRTALRCASLRLGQQRCGGTLVLYKAKAVTEHPMQDSID
jgi:hypothetical protein